MNATFTDKFNAIFEQDPFPWQQALYERFAAGDIPGLVNLPTGLGKTSIVALWLLARYAGANVPRRLVYVVNRRTVVDQTTREVERLVANLSAAGFSETPAVSTLRGQYVDNREWSADPSRAAVVCGTVDMIGSRLLFSGYGASFRTRPLYAGFLGQDALFVHDEAHLEPAFQKVLEKVEGVQRSDRDPWPIRVMALSATSRSNGATEPFGLTEHDRVHPVVRKRVHSRKALQLVRHGEKDLPSVVAERALSFLESKRAILVFLRTVDDVTKVVTALEKGGASNVRMLSGTMRGFERERLVRSDPIFQRFLPSGDRKAQPLDGTVYLVSTSAGEVGVNLSADHLVCDLSPFDSMAQRFGRVNRFGEHDDTEVHVFHPASDGFKEGSPLDLARERTLKLLEALQGDASPASLGKIPEKERRGAFTPEPRSPRIDDIVLDAWTMTTIRDLPGRPDVAPYLHGIADWEPPQTRVAWRDEVEWLERTDEDKNARKETLPRGLKADELLDEYPLKPHEWLTDSTSRVATTLFDALEANEDLGHRDVWIVRDGSVQVRTLGELFGGPRLDKKLAERDLREATILLPATSWHPVLGFLRSSWTSDGSSADVSGLPAFAEDGQPQRFRVRTDDPGHEGGELRRVITIQIAEPSEREDDPDWSGEPNNVKGAGSFWIWFERPHGGDTEGSRSGKKAVLLDVHLADVESAAKRICKSLPLKEAQKEAVALAGAIHDLGKRRPVWQRSIGNRRFPPYLAKAKSSQREVERSRYRHELGSLVDAAVELRLDKLDDEHRDLVLHLVAAHHGRARPHFPKDELFDPSAKASDVDALGIETLRRFARLQKRFGRWGLAYLESLLRAADYAASAEPSKEEP